MGRRVIDGFVIEETAILCPECQAPFRTEILTEPRKVNSSDIIEADLHRVFVDPELRSILLSACPNCTYCGWTSSFKPFKIKAELLKKESAIAPCKKFALAVKWARQKKVHALDIAFIAVNGLWCAREASEPDNLWLELAIFEHEKGMSITPPRPQEEGMAHLLLGELYRQHKDYEKALAQYDIAEQDTSVSKAILDHQRMMCKRGLNGVAALPLKIARHYFEIEDISEKKDMDFSPGAEANASANAGSAPSEVKAAVPPAAAANTETKPVQAKAENDSKPVTAAAPEAKNVEWTSTKETSKAKQTAEPPVVPSVKAPTLNKTGSSAGSTAPAPAQAESAASAAKSTPAEDEARPLLAAISSLFSASTKSILDQYASDEADGSDDLSSLSKELEKTAGEIQAPSTGLTGVPSSSDISPAPRQTEPVAQEAAADQPAFMAATGTDSAKPLSAAPQIKSVSVVSADATIPSVSAKAPSAPVTPAAAFAPTAPSIQRSAAPVPAPAPAAPGPVPAPTAASPATKAATPPPAVTEEEDIPAPVRKNFEEPKTVALGSLSTPKRKENSNAKQQRPKNNADIIPQLAVAPDPEEIQRSSNPRLKAIAPKPEAKPVMPTETAARSSASASTGGSSASTAASAAKPQATKAEEPIIRSRASVITAPPSSTVSLSVTSISAPKPAEQQAAKQESPVPILAEPARKVKKKRIKPPREDHHFARHPVVLNTRPNENGWINDYGNGSVATAPAAQSTREERVETKQRPSENAERHGQKQQQQSIPQEAAATEAGAPLPGLAIDDTYRRDYSDAINRVESYLSLSRRIQTRNWMKL